MGSISGGMAFFVGTSRGAAKEIRVAKTAAVAVKEDLMVIFYYIVCMRNGSVFVQSGHG